MAAGTGKKTLRAAVGQLMVVGVGGTELTGLERAWLRLMRPAGVILFRRNIADAKQTRSLLAEVGGVCAAHPLRLVDVEGGTVDRLRDALAPIPSAQAVAATADSTLMRQHGELVGEAARAFGFNTTLAPVLDLALPPSRAVMGTRVVSPDPSLVVAYAREFLAGLKACGVAGCGKHFPGLGGGALDSHVDTPQIERSWRALWDEDMRPYRELSRELPMIMVSHAAYPATPGRRKPASASPYWVGSVLKARIGYQGLVFSDDLEMGGILQAMPIEEAAVAAARAGMHLVEVCHSPELILRCYEGLLREAERSAAFGRLAMERAAEGRLLRERLAAAPMPAPLTDREMERLRARIGGFSERIANAGAVPE